MCASPWWRSWPRRPLRTRPRATPPSTITSTWRRSCARSACSKTTSTASWTWAPAPRTALSSRKPSLMHFRTSAPPALPSSRLELSESSASSSRSTRNSSSSWRRSTTPPGCTGRSTRPRPRSADLNCPRPCRYNSFMKSLIYLHLDAVPVHNLS
ncbi:Ejaculatory bulb-specific protein 3 [Frankliniella occidentalis]|nr:Ejaculatory bulb-specific protein 3 [Frankliniella occidentalis]